jgi:hypothetical protein
VPLREQALAQVRADEPGAAGDQDASQSSRPSRSAGRECKGLPRRRGPVDPSTTASGWFAALKQRRRDWWLSYL